MTNTAPAPRPLNTTAYYLQSIVSFGIALGVVIIGQLYLPVPAWTRAFLAIGTVFLVSASFTLAKCIRGRCSITSAPGQGTEIEMVVPLR